MFSSSLIWSIYLSVDGKVEPQELLTHLKIMKIMMIMMVIMMVILMMIMIVMIVIIMMSMMITTMINKSVIQPSQWQPPAACPSSAETPDDI